MCAIYGYSQIESSGGNWAKYQTHVGSDGNYVIGDMSVTCDGLWKKYGKEDALLQARVALFAFGGYYVQHVCVM